MKKIIMLSIIFTVSSVYGASMDRIGNICRASAKKIFEVCKKKNDERAFALAYVYCDDFMDNDLAIEDYRKWTIRDATRFCKKALRLEAEEMIELGDLNDIDGMVKPEEETYLLASLKDLKNCNEVKSFLWNQLLEFPDLMLQ